MQTTFELKIRVKLVQMHLIEILEWKKLENEKIESIKTWVKMFQNFQVSVQESGMFISIES